LEVQCVTSVIKQLPQLLRQNPEIAMTIEGMVAHQYPRRDEFARLLEEVTHLWQELKLHREDTNDRFERLWQELKLLREDTNSRFEQVDKRMAQIDKRMAQFEKRMAQVEKRIAQVEQRLDLLHQDVNQLRDEMNRRFEQMQQEMDRRFEQMQQEMDLRFEDEKRERKEMKRRLIKVESAVERLDKKITQFDAWLNVVTGNVGEKRGQEAEQLFICVRIKLWLKKSRYQTKNHSITSNVYGR
jgi:chromosome segregation ATPase